MCDTCNIGSQLTGRRMDILARGIPGLHTHDRSVELRARLGGAHPAIECQVSMNQAAVNPTYSELMCSKLCGAQSYIL